MSALARAASDPQTAPERLVELSSMPGLRPLVAANVGTPAECLEVLSEDASAEVRQAVAQNPNAALPCLLKLAREFPEAFFLNPLCTLLNLSDPGWYARIDDETWLYLLKSAKIPRYWLNWIEERRRSGAAAGAASSSTRSPEVWVAARLHITMPELHAHGEHIGRDLEREISTMARCERTPGPILAELAAVVCHYTSLAEIGNAACEVIPRVVAENSQAPEHVLRQLALAEDPKVRYRVGQNPCTPVDVLERLFTDAVAYVKSGVAMNPALPSELLERFAAENSPQEMREDTEQPGITGENAGLNRMQMQEATNNRRLIMGALAGAEATPGDVLSRLASHSERTVRERLATNPAVAEDVLLSMLSDIDQVLSAMVTKNPRVPVKALEQLAEHKTSRIRIAVARHPRTPGEVLARLARDSHLLVRTAVAKHPCAPVESLMHLAQEGERNKRNVATAVRAAVAINPVTPHRILTRLANQRSRDINLGLAKNPKLPAELIKRLLADEDQNVCLQIASHPQLSQEELSLLSQHPSQPVAELARKRLDLWRELGPRGEQQYAYRFNPDESMEVGVGAGARVNMPFYEIQRRAQGLRNPDVIPAFLDAFQLSAAARREIFVALLPELVQRWKNHPAVWTRLFAAFDLPSEWQRFFAASPLWLVRYALAIKPGVETAVLETLVDDGNRYVRAAARWYLQERREA